MFDIGFAELLLIGVIGLIVVGPKRLPEAARFLGYWVGKLRRTVTDARSEMERELGIDDIKREVHNALMLEQLDKERREVQATIQGHLNSPEPENNISEDLSEQDAWVSENTREDITLDENEKPDLYHDDLNPDKPTGSEATSDSNESEYSTEGKPIKASKS